ncbi:hypothetical protein B0T22DRAFT_487092 [Podospora appendiculata]|uniref:2EXR domain-containing protein n=1 Tax=Podospora appendiculata TaxID=314037 RepID=A0AAE1CGF7_9PEZI|nr:hypothetical protein B0T22DRAFT_487092 [Podospora appendiculata]
MYTYPVNYTNWTDTCCAVGFRINYDSSGKWDQIETAAVRKWDDEDEAVQPLACQFYTTLARTKLCKEPKHLLCEPLLCCEPEDTLEPSTEPSMDDPTTFPIFSRLPSDMREAIYLETVDPYVQHYAQWQEPGESTISLLPMTPRKKLRRRFSDIPLYHVCREAREIAIRRYGPITRYGVPFDPAADTCLISAVAIPETCEFYRPRYFMSDETYRRVQNLTLSLEYSHDTPVEVLPDPIQTYTTLTKFIQTKFRAVRYLSIDAPALSDCMYYDFDFKPELHPFFDGRGGENTHTRFFSSHNEWYARDRAWATADRGWYPYQGTERLLGYDQCQKQVYALHRLALMDALARLSSEDNRGRVLVPFHVLRVFEVMWREKQCAQRLYYTLPFDAVALMWTSFAVGEQPALKRAFDVPPEDPVSSDWVDLDA